MTRHHINMPVYWLWVGMACVFLSPVISIFASVYIAETRADRVRVEQAANDRAAQVATRQVVCGWIGAFLDTYDEAPPTTETGRNLRARFIDLYALSQCQPERK